MGKWYSFKEGNPIKIDFTHFWKGVYSKKERICSPLEPDVLETKQDVTKVVTLVQNGGGSL